jgi:hypothetical protein
MFNAVRITFVLYRIDNQLKYQLIKTFNERTQIQSFSSEFSQLTYYIYRFTTSKKYLYLKSLLVRA